MLNVIKILLFLGVNAAGWFTVSTTYVLLTKMNLIPNIEEQYLPTAQQLYFFVGPLIYIAMAIVSVGYFFAPKEWRAWLLLAPIYVPALYTIGLTAYFHYV